MKWNQGLSGQPLQIAQTNNSPLWVAAGPGTGKTYSLMRRLARLLEADNVDPNRILVCTFTRTAAADLEKSVANLGISDAENVRSLTIHAFCFSMLSRQEVLEATGRTPRPLLQSEERFLLEDMKHAGLGGIRDCSKRLKAFSAAWARLQHEQPGWPSDPTDKHFHSALLAWLRFHGAMLVGELIPEALRYLGLNPGAPYLSDFDHILVDEYQDLNRAEQQLIDVLSNGSLVVIGDEDQSIYSFKHAHPQGIVEFPSTHPHTEQAQLDECRRCPLMIVEMANSLIEHNATRSARKLRPAAGNPRGEVFCVQWSNVAEESAGIARFLKARIDKRLVAAGSVLLLAPRREFGYAVRDELRNLNVPAHSFFSEELLEGDPKDIIHCQAQCALSLLMLLANPNDRVALRTWCGYGSSSLNASAWARLRNHCEATGESPWLILEALTTGALKIAYTTPVVDRFNLLKSELARLNAYKGEDLINGLFPAGQAWIDPFLEMKNYFDDDDFGARELVTVIQRHITQPELPTDVDYVRVMSLHKSKGLTADMVIILGCLEGLMPFIDYDASPQEQQRSLEEQRRLFYVAVTRARQTVVLSSVTNLPIKMAYSMRAMVGRRRGSNSSTMTSRFVGELGPRCPSAIKGDTFLGMTT